LAESFVDNSQSTVDGQESKLCIPEFTTSVGWKSSSAARHEIADSNGVFVAMILNVASRGCGKSVVARSGRAELSAPALEFLHFSSQPGVILREAPHRMVQGEAKNLAVSPGPWSTWTLAAVFSIRPIAQVLPVAISRLD